ncbi:MAG TPA: hypothetical protein VMU59_06905 [Caulobacteraceae bacterium]|nr:hypothetical protein [Caulobacteraceae bacterium]
MKLSTAVTVRLVGVGLTVAMLAAEFCSFYLHLFVLPVVGMPFLIVATLAPALAGISIYNRTLKAEEAKAVQVEPR